LINKKKGQTMTYKPTKKDLQRLTEMQKLFIKIVIEMKKRKDKQ
jgi:hypothetical protein